ncbi:hypothetical protein C4D60_Mb10t02990 [Musa balbisiana]|uniref:Uncharacterized protein n=1 Tax=Musa balbisiana TaxID=52838 RepID=A0A4S8IUD1_MUSBA|nr:hypothetical protein C4D60_Mb10t02990 [Musa balbisiana]
MGWRRREPFVFGSCGSSACGLPGETESDCYPSRRPRSPERRRARGVGRNLQQRVAFGPSFLKRMKFLTKGTDDSIVNEDLPTNGVPIRARDILGAPKLKENTNPKLLVIACLLLHSGSTVLRRVNSRICWQTSPVMAAKAGSDVVHSSPLFAVERNV